MTIKKTTLFEKIDFVLFGWIIHFFYPEYYRPKYGYQKYYKLFFHYLIPQKLFRLNPNVNWPVHFTSKILSAERIKKGIICDPGDNPGIYIQANNGIIIGSNVGFGAGTKIISSIHSHDNHSNHDKASAIIIGNNVFVGANSVILPNVAIGEGTSVGALSLVASNLDSWTIYFGNPLKRLTKRSKALLMKKDAFLKELKQKEI